MIVSERDSRVYFTPVADNPSILDTSDNSGKKEPDSKIGRNRAKLIAPIGINRIRGSYLLVSYASTKIIGLINNETVMLIKAIIATKRNCKIN